MEAKFTSQKLSLMEGGLNNPWKGPQPKGSPKKGRPNVALMDPNLPPGRKPTRNYPQEAKWKNGS